MDSSPNASAAAAAAAAAEGKAEIGYGGDGAGTSNSSLGNYRDARKSWLWIFRFIKHTQCLDVSPCNNHELWFVDSTS